MEVLMAGNINFWDSNVWTFMTELALIFGSMLLANMLRRMIKPLRQSLIPSAVIAGFLLLIVNGIYSSSTGDSLFQKLTLETLTYHGLGLGFAALALKTNERVKDKKAGRDIFNTGVTVVATYLLQAVIGLAITLVLSYIIGNWASSGLLLPMGYGQGPGQAYNWGNTYETATSYPPFVNGASFGLTIAAMGFISASIGGVIYLSIIKAKGSVKGQVVNAEEVEDLSAEMVTKKGEIPMSESLDKLTVQVALVFFTYMAAYLVMLFASKGMDALGGFFSGTVKPLIWGFNFLIATLMAMIVKFIFGKFRKSGVMKREYKNNFMLSRIAGLMFDLMVTASIAAIDLSAFKNPDFIVPLLLVCIAGGVATYLYVNFISKRLFPDYRNEAFLSIYGMLTGTASTGVILLREIDPMFRTPASNNLIYQQLWAIVFGFPMLLLMGIAPQSTTWTILTLVILLLLMAVMNIILFRNRLFKKKNK